MAAKIFIITGPSGVGKGTIVNELLRRHPDFVIPSSYTTRAPRKVEGTKKKYIFVNEKKFKQAVHNNQMIEYEFEHRYWYGTDKKSFQTAISKNQTIIIEIEPRGALNVRKQYPKITKIIFVTPPNINSLVLRIKNDPRREGIGITEEEIKVRMESARKEMAFQKDADYAVVNNDDEAEKAITQVENIILMNQVESATIGE